MNKRKKLKNKELRELLIEQSYMIEALEDEAESLEQECADRRAKLWEVIQENDRLTLRYEPFRPEGDEDEGYDFYELIEENKELRAEVAGLKIRLYVRDQLPVVPTEPVKKKAKIKNDRWWNASFELWPGAWDLNYYKYDWKKYGANTREGSFQIGPFGFSWNREPKRG